MTEQLPEEPKGACPVCGHRCAARYHGYDLGVEQLPAKTLVERLRLPTITPSILTCREAAAEIERLRAESARDHNRWAVERLALLAEVERLRAQLKRVAQHYEVRSEIHTNDADLAATMFDIARAAPQETPK